MFAYKEVLLISSHVFHCSGEKITSKEVYISIHAETVDVDSIPKVLALECTENLFQDLSFPISEPVW